MNSQGTLSDIGKASVNAPVNKILCFMLIDDISHHVSSEGNTFVTIQAADTFVKNDL